MVRHLFAHPVALDCEDTSCLSVGLSLFGAGAVEITHYPFTIFVFCLESTLNWVDIFIYAAVEF